MFRDVVILSKSSHLKRILCGALAALCASTSWAMNNNSSSRTSLIEGLAQCNDPDEAQKNIRMYATGNLENCLNLYKEAKQKDNPIAQIYIANAYYAMHWAKDSAKNFNTITPRDLESYTFSHDTMTCLKGVESKINPDLDLPREEKDRIKDDTFAKAANQGNTFAQMALIVNDHIHLDFAAAC